MLSHLPYVLASLYFRFLSVKRLRAERACLLVKLAILTKRPGNMRTIVLVQCLLDASFDEAMRRGVRVSLVRGRVSP